MSVAPRKDKRTGRWFFRTWVHFPNGKRDRVFGTPGVPGPYHDLPPTKAGAIEAERRAIAKILRGDDVRIARAIPTIREYAKTLLEVQAAGDKAGSKRDKDQRLEHDILPAVGDLRLDELRQHHVDGIIATMLARKVKRRGAETTVGRKTVNNSLGVLSTLVLYAVRNKLIADPELSFSIDAQQAELEAVAAADVDLLVAAARDPRYVVAILLAADAGLRIGEIRALERASINELAREIDISKSRDRTGVLGDTKGHERRAVPASDRLWSALRAVPDVGPLVFSRRDGDPIGYDAVRDRLHEIYDAAKVGKPMHPWHALRHTFGTELARAGVPVDTIRRLLGHKSIDTTLRYMHVDRGDKRRAIDALAAGSQWAAELKTRLK